MRLRIWVVNGGFDRRKLKTPVLGLTQITKAGVAELQHHRPLTLPAKLLKPFWRLANALKEFHDED